MESGMLLTKARQLRCIYIFKQTFNLFCFQGLVEHAATGRHSDPSGFTSEQKQTKRSQRWCIVWPSTWNGGFVECVYYVFINGIAISKSVSNTKFVVDAAIKAGITGFPAGFSRRFKITWCKPKGYFCESVTTVLGYKDSRIMRALPETVLWPLVYSGKGGVWIVVSSFYPCIGWYR